MRASDFPNLVNLSTPEKILLVEDLWDSFASDQSSVPVLPEHLEELDRRLNRCTSNPDNILTLEETRRRMSERI
ncbi:MAG: addiction module protein [Candidatus Hydrogenedentes bacterium]|nr:addiction module protein [Candidatus Hydrogenedentota bacterium]